MIRWYGNFLLYATIHAKQSANAEKFTHGEEHLKLISPTVWIICMDHLHRAHSAEYAQVKQKASKLVETRSNLKMARSRRFIPKLFI